MPLALKSGVLALVISIVAGALYLAWVRGPALVIDLSSGFATIFCL